MVDANIPAMPRTVASEALRDGPSSFESSSAYNLVNDLLVGNTFDAHGFVTSIFWAALVLAHVAARPNTNEVAGEMHDAMASKDMKAAKATDRRAGTAFIVAFI